MSAKAKNGIASYIMRPFMWLFSGLKWLGIAIVVMIAIFVSYVMYMSGKVSYPMSVNTTDTEIVHIKLDGKVPLYIPKAYLTRPRTWKGGRQEAIPIEAVLPNMLPVSSAQGIDEKERVYITFYSAIESKRSGMIDEIYKLKPYLEETDFGIGKLLPSFYEAKQSGKISVSGYSRHEDHYLAVVENQRHIRFRCEKTAPRCMAYTTFDDILGSYIVDKSYIPERWKEVDDKVVNLIQKFRHNLEQEQ